MAAEVWLMCRTCGSRSDLAGYVGCPVCAGAGRVGVLEVSSGSPAMDEAVEALAQAQSGLDAPAEGIWRWRAFLPVIDPGGLVTLGEGATPLLPARRAIQGVEGMDETWLKCEGQNPTQSFKDRFHAVAVSAARALGARGIVCASTGNHGVSAAAFAARAGLACLVLAHEEAPEAHVDAIRTTGAGVVLVPGPERGALLRALAAGGWFPATTFWPLPVGNPFGVEGYKTIAYELVAQLGAQLASRATVFVPAGVGDGLFGIGKGFGELVRLGLLPRRPRLIACQPESAAPLVAAERSGASTVASVEVERSLALSIREAESGDHALAALRTSGGGAVAVSDDEILRAAARLAQDGVLVDPASAAALAGATQLASRHDLHHDGPIVCILTASGARWPRPAGYLPPGPLIAAADARTAERLLAASGPPARQERD
jgi:threonine synthase